MSSAATAKVKLLVVDDTPAIAAMLEATDREVMRVTSCADALQAIGAHDIAVCVLSAHCDGAATAAAIEASSPVPVLLLGARDAEFAPILRTNIATLVKLHRDHAREAAQREAKYVELQREFLTTLGQELRPPLNVMLGWIRMLREGTIREPQRAHALATIERSALAELELIEEMLDISRMTSNALNLELAVVDLRGTVAAVVEAHRPAALDKQITLFAALDDDVAPMSADPERMRQIVHALVKNAVTSTPVEGVVTVSLRNVDATVELAVTDTGNAIAVAPRMFDGFAVVRHLVELHDGTLRVEEPGASGASRRIVVNVPAAGRLPRTDDEAR